MPKELIIGSFRDYFGRCETCDQEWHGRDDKTRAAVVRHTKKTGHETSVETTITKTYSMEETKGDR